MPTQPWDWHAARRICLRETRRHVAGTADAEDAAQAALLRAWRNRDAVHDPAARIAWLRTIARREALRRHGTQDLPLVETAAGAPARTPAIIAAVDVRRALRGLSPEDRALALLRYGADLTQPAVADALGVPEGTVKVRLHRLRRRLEAELDSYR